MWQTESLKTKVRLAAKHADAIRRAIKQSVDANRAVFAWLETHPVIGHTSPDMVRAWADGNIFTEGEPLRQALGKLYAEAWVLGQDIGESAMLATSHKAVFSLSAAKDAVGHGDWNAWKAGNRPAAALLRPPAGLAALMHSRKVDIQGINKTTTDRIGTYLANSLKIGETPANAAKGINTILNDPERALMIAETEMNRAVSVATRDVYENLGVDYVEWFTADGCPICADNEGAGPIPIDATFPSGDSEPPAHPNCLCTLAPASSDRTASE